MSEGGKIAKPNSHSAQKHNDSAQFRPSVTQMAQRAKENGNSSNGKDDSVQMARNSFGEPAFFQPNPILQAKLNVGSPGDKYEKEADSVADKVVANGASEKVANAPVSPVQLSRVQPGDLQKKGEGSGEEELQAKEEETVQEMASEEKVQEKKSEETIQSKADKIETIQPKSNSEAVAPVIQREAVPEETVQKEEEESLQKEEESIQKSSSAGDDGGSDDVESKLSSSRGGGNSMDDGTKSKMESGIGKDFSGVNIHNDSNAAQMSNSLGAQAFTSGNDIYFNEGKYKPGTKEGDHLLAHELTHTVQQGASTDAADVQKQEEPIEGMAALKPSAALDITHRFELNTDWSTHLDKLHADGNRQFEVDVKIGERFSGTILMRKLSSTAEGETSKYDLVSTGHQKYLEVTGWAFLDPLRAVGVTPILVLNNFGDEQITTGFLSVKIGDAPLTTNIQGFIKGLNENLGAMKFLGIEPLEIASADLENIFEQGRLIFSVSTMSTVVDGYLEAGGGMGITGDAFTFNVNAAVDIEGIASGELMIARDASGSFSGSADIRAEIANVQAALHVEYIDGAVTIMGTGKMESEKFSGEITLLVTDKVKSKQMMNAALGVETMDTEADNAEVPVAKTKGGQVLAGWGEVAAQITPWLSGNAKIGIDSEGHVTIVGEVTVDDEIELMEQRGKKVDIFKVEIRAGYGIPLVGQVFLFASIGMFMNSGFGPLVLKDVGFTGTYSTDPSILQDFSITGTLGINAFAILGLEAEAGVGLTLLGHDLKAGVNLTAAAGIRAYAEATPTLEYKEQASPEGGKVGETRLKGHFEAAAQLFLQLSGALFFEIDSPWWSPAPDGREEFPMGEVQYPIGDSMGIGADMDWLVGSPDVPELTFSPVEFDSDKFTADVMADPPPKKYGDADAAPAGEWVDGNAPSTGTEDPTTKDGDGLPDTGKKKEDLKNLPDEEKYMRALDEMSKLEKVSPKPTAAVVRAKADKVKKKYGLDLIRFTDNDETALIYVKHKEQDNTRNILEVPLMSVRERALLVTTAMTDLQSRSTKAAGEDGKIAESGANDVLVVWKTAHPVIEEANVVDGGSTWDYSIDTGDKVVKEKGTLKIQDVEVDAAADTGTDAPSIFALNKSVNVDGGHTLKIEGSLDKVEVNVYSEKKTLRELIALKNTELTEAEPSAVKDYDEKMLAIARLTSEIAELDTHIGSYKTAVDQAYDDEGGGNKPITIAYDSIQSDLAQLAKDLIIVGILEDDYDLPVSNVEFDYDGVKAMGIKGDPISKIPGGTKGSTPTQDPAGWTSIPVALRSKTAWVRAHLLNHRLHGPGIRENLFPGTRKMNSQDMHDQVEKQAKEAVWDKNLVIYYEVKLTYGNSGDFEAIPTVVEMSVYKYDLEKKAADKSDKISGGRFTQDEPTEVEVWNVNSSTAGSLNKKAKELGFNGLSGFFSKVVEGRSQGVYESKEDIEDVVGGIYENSGSFDSAYAIFKKLENKKVLTYNVESNDE